MALSNKFGIWETYSDEFSQQENFTEFFWVSHFTYADDFQAVQYLTAFNPYGYTCIMMVDGVMLHDQVLTVNYGRH